MSGGRRSGLAGSLHSFSFGVPETRECAMFGQATRLEFRTCLFPDRWPQNHVPTPRGTRAVESAPTLPVASEGGAPSRQGGLAAALEGGTDASPGRSEPQALSLHPTPACASGRCWGLTSTALGGT